MQLQTGHIHNPGKTGCQSEKRKSDTPVAKLYIHVLQVWKGGKLVAHHGEKKEGKQTVELHLENWCLESEPPSICL